MEKVIILGYIKGKHRGQMVVDGKGIAPTITENHGKILKVLEQQGTERIEYQADKNYRTITSKHKE